MKNMETKLLDHVQETERYGMGGKPLNVTRCRRIVTMLSLGVLIGFQARSQVLNNSTRMKEKEPLGIPQENLIKAESLDIDPGKLSSIKNAATNTLTLPIPSVDPSKKVIDSLNSRNDELQSLNDNLKKNNKALNSAVENLRIAKVRLSMVYKENERIAAEQKVRDAEKAAAEKKVEELKARFDLLAIIAKKQAATSNLLISIRKLAGKLDSSSHLTDSLTVLQKNLLPDLRSKVAKNKFVANNLHTMFDTTQTRDKRILMNDTLSDIDAAYVNIADEQNFLLSSVHEELAAKRKRENELQSILVFVDQKAAVFQEPLQLENPDDIDRLDQKITLVQKDLTDIDKSLRGRIRLEILEGNARYREILKLYLEQVDQFKVNTKKLQSFQKANFVNKTASKATDVDFEALPNLSQLIGENRAPNLNINIAGQFSFQNQNSRSSFESRLFTANVPKTMYNPRALFIPEISSFGVQVKYVLGWELTGNIGNKKVFNHLGLNMEVNLLNKRVLDESLFKPEDDLSNFIAHFKGGYEQVVIKERMSVYVNLNWLGLIDNVKNFHVQYDQYLKVPNKNTYWFGDFGTRLLLIPGTNKGDGKGDFQLFSDINFILPGSWGRNIIQTEDKILTLAKIGFRKSLGVIHR